MSSKTPPDQFKQVAEQFQSGCKVFEDDRLWAADLAKAQGVGAEFLKGIANAPANFPAAVDFSKFKVDLSDSDPIHTFSNAALSSGINPCSPRFFGYVPGGGLPAASVGDMLAAITNRYGGVYRASPGAAEIENALMSWMIERFGFGESSWGTLTSGGTTATIAAFCAARDRLPPQDWPKLVVYSTEEAHNALTKSLNTVGLGYIEKGLITTNAHNQMDAKSLQSKIAQDKKNGQIPWLVYATVGTVNTGAVDPIGEIASICKDSIWLHIDGAYGGFFALSENPPEEFIHLHLADSLVIDPHKGLFQPYGLGAVICKEGSHLKTSFALTAPYLKEVEDEINRSPSDYSFELTRHFRGLRLWISLKTYGIKAFENCLSEKLILARFAQQELGRLDDLFEVGPDPELSIVTFRLKGDSNDGQKTEVLLQRILTEGKFHLSSTRVKDKYYLRICLLCFRSHYSHVEEFIDYVTKSAISVLAQ